MTSLGITRLRVGTNDEPIGVGDASPALSWITEGNDQAWRQTGYEIGVSADEGTTWTDYSVASADSLGVVWPAEPLRSRERRLVRVRTSDDAQGATTPWSDALAVEAGPLSASEWSAQFIGPAGQGPLDELGPCPHLRHEFQVGSDVLRARLYCSALGVYEIELNGKPVGDHVLAPGWTSYHHRLRYQTFDVTALVRSGANAIGAIVGDGWYRGSLGWTMTKNCYGERVAAMAQLEITHADGTVTTVGTDRAWRWSPGPILSSGLYEGESYDARLEMPGWSSPGFDDRGWSAVEVVDHDVATLEAPVGPPVRRIETIEPVSIETAPSGATIIDFGQNLVGRLRLRVAGPSGTTITLRHAEVLRDGELCVDSLRNAAATDTYTLGGRASAASEVEEWEPRFTFHGFRYVEVSGWPGPIEPNAIVAVVCHSDMERTGWFECSDARVNRLHENIVWSLRDNFLDVPTDCPQRDERLGWTGDAQVFAPAATFLYDCHGFFESWLRDMRADQSEAGTVPIVVPDCMPQIMGTSMPATDSVLSSMAGWSDAAAIMPWVLHDRFGDIDALRRHWPMMSAHVDFYLSTVGDRRVTSGFQLGDWLDPAAPPDNAAGGRTDAHLVATGYLAHVCTLAGRAGRALGEADAAGRYEREAALVRDAFRAEFVSPNGRLVSDSQTAYSVALEFDLLLPEQRPVAARRLAELVDASGGHIATGFLGTPLVPDALVNGGHHAHAYRLLLTDTCPSWLYPLTQGATTVWERWDAIKPDGSHHADQMSSFNHYAYGAIADWLHRRVAGLAPGAPGYRQLRIEPIVEPGLDWARARHRTPYGMAEAGWRRDGDEVVITAIVPTNTTARIAMPDGTAHEVGAGSHQWRCSAGPAVSGSAGDVPLEVTLTDR